MNNIYLHKTNDILDIPDTNNIHIDRIDEIENNSVESMYIQDLLDYTLPSEQPALLEKIAEKLNNKGLLYIQAPDIKQLAVALTFDKVNIELAQMLTYKERVFMHSAQNIIDLLSVANYKLITQKYINIFEYYFTAQIIK